jgi:adenine deaminase
LLLAATDVGIPTLIPGISLHEELELMVKAGLTPLQALRSATVNPARVVCLADSLGTITVGKLADLVLLEANPLTDIRTTQRIRAVISDGSTAEAIWIGFYRTSKDLISRVKRNLIQYANFYQSFQSINFNLKSEF